MNGSGLRVHVRNLRLLSWGDGLVGTVLFALGGGDKDPHIIGQPDELKQ